MNINRADYYQTAQAVTPANNIQSLDDKIIQQRPAPEENGQVNYYYMEYMQNILMSDGTDPNNQPEW